MSDDHGLQHDLRRLLDRRRMLILLGGGAAVAAIAAQGRPPRMPGAEADVTAIGPDGAECVKDPEETAGPYPADGSNRAHGTLANVLADSGIVRTDMRGDLKGTAAAPGVPLELTLALVDVGNACRPLAGYALYLWHCDAGGRYSLYDLAEQTYLRAVGVADARGEVTFTTILPGCYRGRYPHMHFEVYPSLAKATDYRNRILTSQLAIPGDTCTAVYAGHAAYAASIGNFAASPLARDMIFADNTAKQLAAQTPRLTGNPDTGYKGRVTIGVKT